MEFLRTYQLRAYSTKAGYRAIDAALERHRMLYNAALEERFAAWRSRVSEKTWTPAGLVDNGNYVSPFVGLKQQSRELTDLREDDRVWSGEERRLAIGTLQRVDEAFRRWSARRKDGLPGGRPRFRSASRFRTLQTSYCGSAWYRPVSPRQVIIRIKGLPDLELRPNRMLPPGKPKNLRITRRGRRLWVNLVFGVESEMLPQREKTGEVAGLDRGVNLLVATSDGESVPGLGDDPGGRIAKLDRKLARLRKLALKEGRAHWQATRRGKAIFRWDSGKPSYRYRKIKAQRDNLEHRRGIAKRNLLHQVSTDLIRRYDTLFVESLEVSKMSRSARGTVEEPGRNVRAKASLNRSILAQGWGALLNQLDYKAESAGKLVFPVPAPYTSMDCSRCGLRNDGKTPERVFTCAGCGQQIDRDYNAAINIRRRGMQLLAASPDSPNHLAGGPGECSTGEAKATPGPLRIPVRAGSSH